MTEKKVKKMKIRKYIVCAGVIGLVGLSSGCGQKADSAAASQTVKEHKYDQALLEVHAIETEYYISLLRDKQEETQKLLSQKENEIRKLADEKAQL